MAYSALKWITPKERPIAQKSQPMEFSGEPREAMTAPTVENPTANKMFSAQ
jgi:hypothetical protein